MNTCAVDDCTEPIHIKKRSLCRGHYMQWWKHGTPDGYTPPERHVQCVQCGKPFALSHGSRKHCSNSCRERAKYLRLCADKDRYAKMLTRVRDSYERKTEAAFYANACDDCGAAFIERVHSTPSRYCSNTCAGRVAKRTRRAREHNAPGSFSFAQVVRQYARQGNACAYCKQGHGLPEPEHVLPLSRGGRNDMSNIVAACSRCNGDKTDRTLTEWAQSRIDRGLPPVDTDLAGPAYRHVWHQEPTSPRWCDMPAAV